MSASLAAWGPVLLAVAVASGAGAATATLGLLESTEVAVPSLPLPSNATEETQAASLPLATPPTLDDEAPLDLTPSPPVPLDTVVPTVEPLPGAVPAAELPPTLTPPSALAPDAEPASPTPSPSTASSDPVAPFCVQDCPALPATSRLVCGPPPADACLDHVAMQLPLEAQAELLAALPASAEDGGASGTSSEAGSSGVPSPPVVPADADMQRTEVPGLGVLALVAAAGTIALLRRR